MNNFWTVFFAVMLAQIVFRAAAVFIKSQTVTWENDVFDNSGDRK